MQQALTSGTAAAVRNPDQNSLNFNASLGMPVFGNKGAASVFVGSSVQSGGAQGSWNPFHAGFSLSRSF